MKKIAIQGIKGCYHHVSLIKYLGENGYEIVECNTFNKLTQIITYGEANLGVMAIENSIIGSIFYNYILLSNHHLKILGSIVLNIEHNLIAFTDKKFNKILSHPIALQQCDNFISEYTQIRKIEYSDTALASLYISKNMLKKKASIASLRASKEYGLSIIYKNIQSISNNFTRLFIIETTQRKIKVNWDKSSILFSLNTNCHSKLLTVLNNIADKKIFITKILSFLDKPGEYLFYIDIILDDYMGYEQMKSNIKKKSHFFSILGEYMNYIFL
ncbi:prephenate dehydratase [Candidatus Uzinura diaspidicola str. ASNER]|uniref:prephenate dehydratase n=1 Tax=Candidatus Uzinura diaspidicola str. ASNER TaxID=1133592 RepID=L7VK06_9FLAO|nr:prephenate dehydratase [Candidatus Uzinura diaspidicola str. ASNER]